MICIYHSRDLDGWMSAAIVKLKHPNAELIGWDYGQPIPNIDIDGESPIIMVDVSFHKNIMQSMADKLIWIDHHISAIKDVASLEPLPFIYGRRNDKFAACELTWQYFFPKKRMPEVVRLLGRYDCFGHKGTDEEQTVLEFQYGARSVIRNIDDAYEFLMATNGGEDSSIDKYYCKEIQQIGKHIYSYLCVETRQKYAQRFSVDFDGYVFACVNAERLNPINFGVDYHKDGYDGFACFWYDHGQWCFSLYNDNGEIDCSEICKKRGGGGHKGAAGFRTSLIQDII